MYCFSKLPLCLLGDAILGKSGLGGKPGSSGWLILCQRDAESQTGMLRNDGGDVKSKRRQVRCSKPRHPLLSQPARPQGAVAGAYLTRSGTGCRPMPDGESAGAAGLSGTCSGRGDGRGAASSAGGAGGCMEGGAQDAFRPAEEPLRATQDVSMTLTPMLARDTKIPAYPRVTGDRLPPPRKGDIQAGPC